MAKYYYMGNIKFIKQKKEDILYFSFNIKCRNIKEECPLLLLEEIRGENYV